MLPVRLVDGTEYSQELYEEVQAFTSEYRTLFYCDGGNKPLEMRICGKIAKPGDILVVHDYDLENVTHGRAVIKHCVPERVNLGTPFAEIGHVTPRQVDAAMRAFGLETIFEEYLGSANGEYRKTRMLALIKKVEDNNGSDSLSD